MSKDQEWVRNEVLAGRSSRVEGEIPRIRQPRTIPPRHLVNERQALAWAQFINRSGLAAGALAHDQHARHAIGWNHIVGPGFADRGGEEGADQRTMMNRGMLSLIR